MTIETTPPAANTTATITSPIVTDGPQPIVASPVVEPTPAPVVVEPAADGTIPPVVDPAAPAGDNTQKTIPEAVQRRINELTAKRYEAERSAAADRAARVAAESRAAELLAQISNKPAVDPAAANSTALTEQEIERRAEEKAVQMSQAAAFNKACDEIVATGKKDFATTWDEAVRNLGMVGAIGQGSNPAFLETAIELKNPAAILNHLGKNLEEAERIAKLPPTKMAMEMARVEALLNAPTPAPVLPPVSQAPAPVIPVGGAAKPGTPDISDPNVSSSDWFELRAKQVEEHKRRYRRA